MCSKNQIVNTGWCIGSVQGEPAQLLHCPVSHSLTHQLLRLSPLQSWWPTLGGFFPQVCNGSHCSQPCSSLDEADQAERILCITTRFIYTYHFLKLVQSLSLKYLLLCFSKTLKFYVKLFELLFCVCCRKQPIWKHCSNMEDLDYTCSVFIYISTLID